MARKSTAMQNVDRHVGKQVKWHRIKKGYSQDDLATLLGISYQQLHKYENGSNSISAGRLADMAKALQIHVTSFFEGLDEMDDAGHTNDSLGRENLLLAKYYNQITCEFDRQAIITLIHTLSSTKPAQKLA